MSSLEHLSLDRFVPMDLFEKDCPLRVNLSYASEESFCGILYRPQARLWLYDRLASLVCLAASISSERYGASFVLYDGLRTVSAQAAMSASDIVRANPAWLEGDDRVISRPGVGAHPRGMAIDIALVDQDGVLLDMGTAYDEMPQGGNGPDHNKAHRLYEGLSAAQEKNRNILENSMMTASALLDIPLVPLSSEWWDFRLPLEIVRNYAPLDDSDLPPQMQMIKNPPETVHKDFPAGHFQEKITQILETIEFYK